MALTFPRPDAAWVEVGPIHVVGEGRICQNQTIWFGKPDTLVFPETSGCAPARLISNHVGEPRHGSLVTLSEVLMCSRFDQKVHQQDQR
jgi:hypothetical protein